MIVTNTSERKQYISNANLSPANSILRQYPSSKETYKKLEIGCWQIKIKRFRLTILVVVVVVAVRNPCLITGLINLSRRGYVWGGPENVLFRGDWTKERESI